ncbi:HlyD family type I secretion periplasmic adaptor subunit [Microvirga sp. SRT01]|jgi:HlyD family secretion protein|uniref:Membrane fusion protein (MFP) family protein n=1 Tax=Sphingomonas longa TaxID=2778730 RepID=A0ABS2D810_9SPHN|nr:MULTISPECIES: HlyD family type I secretion periplasmic adaptor subunit [Alphaproteobacteria]MBM6577033.1 HlyD family type I secretion periplasmic adaptor subunit [Sphingomonas sp. BT552]MBR7710077.1 HlyD family type I secretion periplasmic adaptor subunit [Microvirga sp. SRT01]
MIAVAPAHGRFGDVNDLDDSPRRALIVGSGVAILFFVVFLGWAAMARLDAAAFGGGQVVVAGNRQVIQHRYGGDVEQVLVRDGQRVRAGDALVRLSGSEVAATERALAGAVIDLQAQRARLEAEVTGGTIRWPKEFAQVEGADRLLVDAAKRLQLAQSQAQRNLLSSRYGILRSERDQLARQIQGFEAQSASTAEQRESLQAQMESTRRLAESGDVSRNTVRALERNMAALDGSNADLIARAAASRAQVAGTRDQVAQARRQLVDENAKMLRETQFQLNDALPKWIAAKEQVERTIVRAPVSGRVVDLRVHSAGGVIAAGQPILDIVPDAAPLEVRATFAPEDIDGVVSGKPAEVKFLSLHDRDLPILMGVVRTVSADSVRDDRTGLSQFTATIVIPDDQVAMLRAARGADTGIRAGVPVQVTVTLQKRSALQYMLDPLTETLSRSFSER